MVAKSFDPIILPSEPSTLIAAFKSDHASQWKLAMQDEIHPLIKNNTWSLVPLPPGRTTIQNKWIFKVKVKSDDSIDRFKAHLVAKGYSQIGGLDFDETYAPTAKADSIRPLLSLAITEDCEFILFDIKTVFLHGDLSKEIYMDFPSRYDLSNSSGKVCRLLKSLYGLKQASCQWNKKFTTFLKQYQVQQNPAHSCVFYSHSVSFSHSHLR